ncbi:hypothetical protein V5O48_013020 [Marasmius crinis-equi]|uniref:AB hydrolase-1 domain-containing protein n=1 Tax=Marasmius crinis-equi TaxID=585013 RepID=A0ABR3F186_9AGAR
MSLTDSITAKNVISSDGGTIYAESIGDPNKPAIIFIPGWTMASIVFDKQFEDEKLRKELYLIRYDPRGHGRSVMPETEEGHASKLYADDFAAVVKAFGVVKPVVATWSLAGGITSDICEHLGHEVIAGVIYLAALPHLDPAFIGQTVPPSMFEHAAGLFSTTDVVAHKSSVLAFGRSLFRDPDSIPFQTRTSWIGAIYFMPPVVTQLVLQRKQDPTKLFKAGKEGLKVLFVQASDDGHRVSPTIIVDLLGEHFSQKEMVIVEKSGHAFFYEKPEETNRILLEWMRKVSTK